MMFLQTPITVAKHYCAFMSFTIFLILSTAFTWMWFMIRLKTYFNFRDYFNVNYIDCLLSVLFFSLMLLVNGIILTCYINKCQKFKTVEVRRGSNHGFYPDQIP
jgi:hypothetical protein